MIVLLSYSTSWCQNNDVIPSTGGLQQRDSLVLVPISTIKVANSKMIELKYEKEINTGLREIITNDSVIINTLEQNVKAVETKATKYKKERNVAIGGVGVSLLLLFLSLL